MAILKNKFKRNNEKSNSSLSYYAALLIFRLVIIQLFLLSAFIVNAGNIIIENSNMNVNNNLYVDSSGNVGIGTITPSAKLHIVTTNNADNFLVDANSNLNYAAAISNSALNAQGLLIKAGAVNGNNAALNITSYDTSLSRLVVMNNGNVGIGNSSPQQKLTVSGIIETAGISGGIKFPDGTIQTTASQTAWATSGPNIYNLNTGGVGIGTILTTINQVGVNVKSARLPSGLGYQSCTENSATHKIYCFGGTANLFTALDQIVEYDPGAPDNSASAITIKSAKLPIAKMGHACAENSATHKVYCIGGDTRKGFYLNQILEYNPSTDSVAPMTVGFPAAIAYLACAENSATHKIYCFGGDDGQGHLFNSIIAYDPAANSVAIMTATLPTARSELSCAENSATRKIYCFGGLNQTSFLLNEIVEYAAVTKLKVAGYLESTDIGNGAGFKFPDGTIQGSAGGCGWNYGSSGLIISGSYNVGIGTATPAYKLEVAGAIKIGSTASTCDANHRGVIRIVPGAYDLFQVCMKKNYVYNWSIIILG